MNDSDIQKFYSQLPQTLAELQHKIRSPLSVIAGLVEDLRDQRTLSKEDIADAGVAVEQLLSLIEQISLPAMMAAESAGGENTL